ncbi:MAG: TIGR03088 family PEP-CTERM/XrtA system glycosyltransferase [Magnetococcales bacterium]|nr:TIGR03088 family PEP-CTERM/XrtA system glycosyltransferase [Magnetococcales bacterium]
MRRADGRVTIAHVVHRFGMGGLENVLVSLVDHLPSERFAHVVIALTEDERGRESFRHSDVEVIALHKREGKDLGVWWRMFTTLRRVKPDILHTCNIATLEMVVPAWLAGVSRRLHAEHGRDIYDLDGSNRKYRLFRRLLSPWVECFIPVSRDLERWLVEDVGIDRSHVKPIVNGVDPDRFQPVSSGLERGSRDAYSIVSVGRLSAVKDQIGLIRGFDRMMALLPEERRVCVSLTIVGEGPERSALEERRDRSPNCAQITLAGARDDVPEVMRRCHLFVLSSLAEGTPLTVLEAMACGLPVVATAVGGVPDLVHSGKTGQLVPPGDPERLAAALVSYVQDGEKSQRHGEAARKRVEQTFDLNLTIRKYQDLFLSSH